MALFICLTVLVKGGHARGLNELIAGQLEKQIAPALTAAAIFISNIGQWYVYLPVSVVLLIIPRTRLKIGLPVALSISASAITNNALKIIFAVPRPGGYGLVQESGFGYPSGHVMNCVVFFGMLAYLFCRYSNRKPYKAICLTAAAASALLMGLSRVYLGVHTVTDALGGCMAGLTMLFSAITIKETLIAKTRGKN